MDPDVVERARELFEEAHRAQMAGRLERAEDLYRQSLRLHPTAEAHTFLGWTCSILGRFGEAIEQCRRAIAVDPDFGNPYNDIGAYLIELGRLDEAVPWLRRAIRAPRYEPRHFPHYNLARIHVARYEEEEGLKCLRRALRLAPGFPAARREMARLISHLN